MRSVRCSARRSAACGSVGAALVRGVAAALVARAVSHSDAYALGASCSGTCPADHSSSNPSACLHGNFRLGHVHRNAGSDRSTTVWYGVRPDPAHDPQTAHGLAWAPVPVHGPGLESLRPAATDDASGASASTCSALQVSGTVVTVAARTDTHG